jgi:hypothetical protein
MTFYIKTLLAILISECECPQRPTGSQVAPPSAFPMYRHTGYNGRIEDITLLLYMRRDFRKLWCSLIYQRVLTDSLVIYDGRTYLYFYTYKGFLLIGQL